MVLFQKTDQAVNNIWGDCVKREEKISRRGGVLWTARLLNFRKKGYGASSINAICGLQGLSKGIFCEAVITPPKHLQTEIEKRKGEFELREERCKKAIDIMLYGIVERKERD